MPKKLTQEQFEEKARVKHGDKYGYDRAVYIGANENIEIFCKKCSKYFVRVAYGYMHGYGCQNCQIRSNCISFEEFKKRSIEKHGDKYNYNKVEFKNLESNIIIFLQNL